MTRLAHIAPTQMLPYLPFRRSGAHFAITRVFAADQLYRNFYLDQVRRGRWVILDNPVHENMPISEDEFLGVATTLQPSVAVLPDVIDDMAKTVANAKRLAGELKYRCPDTLPMVVPHGVAHDEFLECAHQLATAVSGTGFIGMTLERRLKDDRLACFRRAYRVRLLRAESHHFDGMRIHYLGISEEANEFTTGELGLVYSADSSKFAVRALTHTEQDPPAPITESYPGREALGGSLAYFLWDPGGKLHGSQERFTNSLGKWSDAAEGKL